MNNTNSHRKLQALANGTNNVYFNDKHYLIRQRKLSSYQNTHFNFRIKFIVRNPSN